MIKDNSSQSRQKKILIFLSVVFIYFIVGWGSLKLATLNDFASPIWIPSGIALGFLVVYGNWLAPAIFIAAFLTNLTAGASIQNLIGISLGNMLEAILGAYLVIWFTRKNSLKKYTEMVAIIGTGVLSSTVSATIGAGLLLISGLTTGENFAQTWYTWWSGDAVGIIIILPLFLDLYLKKQNRLQLHFRTILSNLLLIIMMLTPIYLVFMKDYNLAFVWVLCPFLTLIGITQTNFTSRIILIVVSIFIIVLISLGHGPFEFGSLNLNLIFLQCLLISFVCSILFVTPMHIQFKKNNTFVITNILGWSIIFLTIFIISKREKEIIREDLNSLILSSLDDISKAIDKYELLLIGGAALVKAKPLITTNEWQQYEKDLALGSKFNAIKGFGFIRAFNKSDTNYFTKEIIQRGIEPFSIKTIDAIYSDQHPDRYVITLIGPMAQNKNALGLDIGSEKNRREAAEESRKMKKTISSDTIALVQDNLKQDAFLLLHPVWTEKNVFFGWTYAPVINEIFYKRTLSQYVSNLHFKINRNAKTVFQTFKTNPRDLNKKYLKEISLEIFGTLNTIIIYPSIMFFQRHSYSLPPLAMLMTLFMFIFSSFLQEQLTFGQRAELLISERTKELEESKIQLINSSKMASLGEMASGMAHEINNPLTIINGKIIVIKMMMDDLQINQPQLINEINKIELTTNRISKIVKALKSFSRASHDDPLELVPLGTILLETLDLCSERIKQTGITLTIDPIPELCLLCRPSQISQVFFNLINNASDAIASIKNKSIEITFKILEPDQLFITITDSGPSIPPEIAKKIMEPFFTTKTVGKGTGLGLSIAKKIIEDHGGTISLDTKYPQTRFVVKLPIKNVGQT